MLRSGALLLNNAVPLPIEKFDLVKFLGNGIEADAPPHVEAVGVGFQIIEQLMMGKEVRLVVGNRKIRIAEIVAAGVDVQAFVGA